MCENEVVSIVCISPFEFLRGGTIVIATICNSTGTWIILPNQEYGWQKKIFSKWKKKSKLLTMYIADETLQRWAELFLFFGRQIYLNKYKDNNRRPY